MPKSLSDTGKGVLLIAFSAAIGTAVWLLPDETTEKNKDVVGVKSLFASTQKTGSITVEKYGREYSIKNGLITEATESTFFSDGDVLSHYKYDFDHKLLIGMSPQGLFTQRFNDLSTNGQESKHIERVRSIGCEIANTYIERSKTIHYTAAPKDVTTFYQRHCKIVIQ